MALSKQEKLKQQEWKCNECGLYFEQDYNLDAHKKNVHEKRQFQCLFCPKRFVKDQHRRRHEKTHTQSQLWSCDECGRNFKDKGNFIRHQKTHETSKPFQCQYCTKKFRRVSNQRRHERIHQLGAGINQTSPQPTNQPTPQPGPSNQQGFSNQPGPSRSLKRSASTSTGFKIEKVATAFRGATITLKLYAPIGNRADEVADLLDKMTNAMKEKIREQRSLKKAIKFNMSLHTMFQQATDESIKTDPPVVLVTEMFELFEDDDDIDEILDFCSKQLQNRIISYEGLGSGWKLETLQELDTTIWTLDPLRAETYHALSRWIWNTHCVINIQNKDNECFRHAIMAGLT